MSRKNGDKKFSKTQTKKSRRKFSYQEVEKIWPKNSFFSSEAPGFKKTWNKYFSDPSNKKKKKMFLLDFLSKIRYSILYKNPSLAWDLTLKIRDPDFWAFFPPMFLIRKNILGFFGGILEILDFFLACDLSSQH